MSRVNVASTMGRLSPFETAVKPCFYKSNGPVLGGDRPEVEPDGCRRKLDEREDRSEDKLVEPVRRRTRGPRVARLLEGSQSSAAQRAQSDFSCAPVARRRALKVTY
jgi:hypothetical protein